MAERFELASQEWLDELFRLFREAAERHPEAEFSVCEVFTNVPKRLDPDGEGKVAWHGVIRDGRAELSVGEVPEDQVDLKTVGEWEALLPAARYEIRLDDPEDFARYQKLTAQAAADGRIRRVGDPSKAPASFVAIHNELARRTA